MKCGWFRGVAQLIVDRARLVVRVAEMPHPNQDRAVSDSVRRKLCCAAADLMVDLLNAPRRMVKGSVNHPVA
jgi:hypothetical protein